MKRSISINTVSDRKPEHTGDESSPVAGKSFRPFERRYDVAIMGGGLCGIGAALTLVRNGKKVIICERRPLLGWEITAAYTCNLDASDSEAVRLVRRAISAAYGLQGDAVDAAVVEVVFDNLADFQTHYLAIQRQTRKRQRENSGKPRKDRQHERQATEHTLHLH